MAVVAVTNRVKSSYGKFKRETGDFTANAGGADFFFHTKLGNIIFCRIHGVNAEEVNQVVYVKNHTATSTIRNGSVWVSSGASNDGTYMYEAIGRG